MWLLPIYIYGYNNEHAVIVYKVVKDTQRECGQPSHRYICVSIDASLTCVHIATGESVKISSGRPANDAVERFVDALMIERLILYLKEPKRKRSC